MKILKLTSRNIKRLKAVQIEPDGSVVKITGKNGAGKTSVLDSIMWALAGGNSIQSKPIREGQQKAEVKLDLGDYTVVRKITAKGAYLEVLSKQGAKYPSPQSMLDKVVGNLSFDPLAFIRADKHKQGKVLRELAGLDLSEFDKREQALAEARSDARRTAQFANDQAIAADLDLPEVVPTELVDRDEVFKAVAEARKLDADFHSYKQTAEFKKERIHSAKELIAEMRLSLDREVDKLTEMERDLEEFHKAATERFQVMPDLGALEEQLNQVDRENSVYEQAQNAKRLRERADEEQAKFDDLQERIEAVRADRAEAIAMAEYPLAGLAVDSEGHVTFQDVPLDQASLAEQIKVSTAVAMAMNPELRVLRITDASLLDSDSLKVIQELADGNDYQVWLEMVDESGKVGFYIEDGSLVAVDGKPTGETDAKKASDNKAGDQVAPTRGS